YFNRVVNRAARMESEAFVALELANHGGERAAPREHLRGDALHNLGLLKEARLAYRKAIKLTGSDPSLESKLGYTEVRLGHKAARHREAGARRGRHAGCVRNSRTSH